MSFEGEETNGAVREREMEKESQKIRKEGERRNGSRGKEAEESVGERKVEKEPKRLEIRSIWGRRKRNPLGEKKKPEGESQPRGKRGNRTKGNSDRSNKKKRKLIWLKGETGGRRREKAEEEGKGEDRFSRGNPEEKSIWGRSAWERKAGSEGE